MAQTRIRLNHDGIAAALKSDEAKQLCHSVAEQIASNARGGLPAHIAETVAVFDYVSDRAGSIVAVRHPSGLAMQAKRGTLTRAAAAIGLEVRSR